ncbi:hypothetical protein [Rhizosphaericola mali]|uniref:Uncharacterized protein n=1 Tax=Rhizosphaericola mali TaxID=2545455 RepID=A0A5P2G4K7_9BACT|nr:hypothetical protein [Rhizosphaericola mali]QES88700.1 hypothetical protein E0W69_008560 [Rhizosphaericola mali]
MKKLNPFFPFLIVFVSLPQILFSQIEQAYEIKLHANKLKNIDSLYITIKTDQVNSLSLGYINNKQGNYNQELLLQDSLGRYFTNLLNPNLTNKEQLSNIVWLCHELTFTTDSSGLYLFSHLNADVYKPFASMEKKTGKFLKLITIDTLMNLPMVDSNNYSIGLDSMAHFIRNTSLALIQNTRQSPSNRISNLSLQSNNEASVSIDSLLANRGNINTNIIKDSLVNKGIFKTFKDFLNNKPISNAIYFWLEPDTLKENGDIKLNYLGTDSSIVTVTNAWGVCFGANELYKMEGSKLIPIEKKGNYFILSKYVDFPIRKNQAILWRRAVGAYWNGDNNPYERKRTLILNTKKDRAESKSAIVDPIATKIDMRTGMLTF